MKNIFSITVLLLAISISPQVLGEEDEDWEVSRSLNLQCNYSDYQSVQIKHVTISVAREPLAQRNTLIPFAKGINTPQEVQHQVKAGQQAECQFPSGEQVRIKVGEGQARPYGMCGGDPEVFVSIWVNRRKVASGIQFAGRCSEWDKNYYDTSFEILGSHSGQFNVQHCGATRKTSMEVTPENPGLPPNPIKICVKYPDIQRFPIDYIEYPTKGLQKKPPGTIELVGGNHAVCRAVLKELRNDFYTFSNYLNQDTVLIRPNWSSPSIELPDELARSSESIFDFDNDGRLDRVLSQLQENTYSDGSVLLVQSGKSRKEIVTSDSVLDITSRFFPCQMDREPHPIQSCPTFSQKADDAGFDMRHGKAKVHFRARYTSLSPFAFRKTNYVGVSTISFSQNYVGVLKPLPGNKFQQMCLFHRVPENY